MICRGKREEETKKEETLSRFKVVLFDLSYLEQTAKDQSSGTWLKGSVEGDGKEHAGRLPAPNETTRLPAPKCASQNHHHHHHHSVSSDQETRCCTRRQGRVGKRLRRWFGVYTAPQESQLPPRSSRGVQCTPPKLGLGAVLGSEAPSAGWGSLSSFSKSRPRSKSANNAAASSSSTVDSDEVFGLWCSCPLTSTGVAPVMAVHCAFACRPCSAFRPALCSRR
eukprot:scaffold1850_cov194-Pinguiococcus_pyrenoidosus.AAC.33